MTRLICLLAQVLLDNLNSAPPEVVERLNSLMEDEPRLHLYEHADGETLSYDGGTIHKDFRLVATANFGRPGAHKLSSALLNRVICQHMPALDAGGHAWRLMLMVTALHKCMSCTCLVGAFSQHAANQQLACLLHELVQSAPILRLCIGKGLRKVSALRLAFSRP